MTRKVFFSFDYEKDLSRAEIVRDSWVSREREASGFIDATGYKKLKKKGDEAVREWIDEQLEGTSATVVLVGEGTHISRWVSYGIDKSIKAGNGLLGINITQIRDRKGKTSAGCARMPLGYRFYTWNRDEGEKRMDEWIAQAEKDAGC